MVFKVLGITGCEKPLSRSRGEGAEGQTRSLSGSFLWFGEGLLEGGHADAMAEVAKAFSSGAGRREKRKKGVQHRSDAV